MYKTVRHGENSLQYTILPQDGDEESGKSSGGQGKSGGSAKGSAGNRGGGAGGGKGCCRPRTVLFLVLTALLVGVVTASVAVPLLLTTDLLSLPGAAFPFSEHRPQMQTRPHQYQHHPAYNATAFHRHPAAASTSSSTSTSTVQPTSSTDTTSPLPSTTKPESVSEESDIAAVPPQEEQREDLQSTTASVPGMATQKGKGLEGDDEDDEDDDDDDEDDDDNSAPVAVPVDDRVDDEDDDEGPSADGPAIHTASTEAVRGGDAAGYLAAPAAPSPPAGNDTRNSIWVTPPRNSTRKDGLQMGQVYGSTPDVEVASTDATGTTVVPQMPLVTATTPPRPITFPTAPTEGAANKHDAWQAPRWLFTDPSSYLQWTGYNRDGLLLPIILGTVVILVPATIAVCFLIIRRRRRQKDLRRETIGKIASDLQYGDKATLLADASEEE